MTSTDNHKPNVTKSTENRNKWLRSYLSTVAEIQELANVPKDRIRVEHSCFTTPEVIMGSKEYNNCYSYITQCTARCGFTDGRHNSYWNKSMEYLYAFIGGGG